MEIVEPTSKVTSAQFADGGTFGWLGSILEVEQKEANHAAADKGCKTCHLSTFA